jgi:hypothetical protein
MATDTENQNGTEAEAPANEQAQNQADIPPEVKRALNKANKEAETLRLKLKEFEDRDKSDLEKLTEERDAEKRRADQSDLRAVKLEIAAEKGLTPAQAKRLVGETRDELESDAQELLDTFKPASNDEAPEVAESLDLGIRSGTPNKGATTADLFAAAIDGSFTR